MKRVVRPTSNSWFIARRRWSRSRRGKINLLSFNFKATGFPVGWVYTTAATHGKLRSGYRIPRPGWLQKEAGLTCLSSIAALRRVDRSAVPCSRLIFIRRHVNRQQTDINLKFIHSAEGARRVQETAQERRRRQAGVSAKGGEEAVHADLANDAQL